MIELVEKNNGRIKHFVELVEADAYDSMTDILDFSEESIRKDVEHEIQDIFSGLMGYPYVEPTYSVMFDILEQAETAHIDEIQNMFDSYISDSKKRAEKFSDDYPQVSSETIYKLDLIGGIYANIEIFLQASNRDLKNELSKYESGEYSNLAHFLILSHLHNIITPPAVMLRAVTDREKNSGDSPFNRYKSIEPEDVVDTILDNNGVNDRVKSDKEKITNWINDTVVNGDKLNTRIMESYDENYKYGLEYLQTEIKKYI